MEMPPPRPRHQPWISEEEWDQRLQLAACYRLFAALGWNDGLFSQISLRVVGEAGAGEQFLVMPYGLDYEDVTASRLVKVDGEGGLLAPTRFQVDPRGFAAHASVHRLREDAICVMKVQTPVSVALSCRPDGLRCDNFYSAQLIDRLGHLDFSSWQHPHLSDFAQSLADHDVLVLRQQGLLSVSYDIPSAFALMWTLHRACEVQHLADCAGSEPLPMDGELARQFAERAPLRQADFSDLAFSSALRKHGISYAMLGE